MKHTLRLYTNTGFLLLLLLAVFSGCKKDPEFVDNNNAPKLDKVPTVLVENYVNRMFIDLIGREPLDVEMDSFVTYLKDNELSYDARLQIITTLQSDNSYIGGDSSYQKAYYHRFYETAKVRMIEGESDQDIYSDIGMFNLQITTDSLTGDSIGISLARYGKEKLEKVLAIEMDYRSKSIDLAEVFRRLADNKVYSEINMNTFNFINATFDNLYFRYPTEAEFDAAWEILELNQSAILMGQSGQNKDDYLNILTTSGEFSEGVITWAYLSLLARAPGSDEVSKHLSDFHNSLDFQVLQQEIMITDEYANF